MSYPSRRRRVRSGLRLISRADNEAHPILDESGLPCVKDTLWVLLGALAIGDRVLEIRPGRRRVRQLHQSLERDRGSLHFVRPSVNQDLVVLVGLIAQVTAPFRRAGR